MALPIEDYALIGDRHTAALVGKDGSIDWLCLPRFDSASCFTALLGTEDHGRWLIAPKGEFTTSRRYIEDSTVLETTFTTDSGVATLVDLMPTGDGRADVVRQLRGTSGTVEMEHEWVVRTDYGKSTPWVRRYTVEGDKVITAIAGPDQLILRGSRLPHAVDRRHRDEFEISEGETMTFSTTWIPSHLDPPGRDPMRERIKATVEQDRAWLAQGTLDGVPHIELVKRSLLTLRLLTHAETGGMVAAPTTSLPEDFGGERNWDYRYCWLRDASLSLKALIDCGFTEEARWWRRWLLRAVAGDPENIQIMYAIDAARDLPERTLDHLPGYADSTPVRRGNAAVDQVQTDIFGEVMIALELARSAGVETSNTAWALQHKLMEGLEHRWKAKDHGLWEIRGPQQAFTHSRVMAWAAFDRTVHAMEEFDLPGPLERWRGVRDEIRDEVMAKGFDEKRNSFKQHYETDHVDASLLVLPMVGFIPGDDPRMLGTLKAIEDDLIRDGLVLRYRTETGVDGLSGDEHPFLACSFWLVTAYALAGRRGDAEKLFERLAGLVNDVGLLSEEYDPGNDRMIGNFPQAFSHLALIQAALHLAD